MIDRLLIFAVFVVAFSELAYELIAGALSSYLLGDYLKAPDDTWKLRLIEEDFHRLMFEMGGA